jgi:hypothetical protein
MLPQADALLIGILLTLAFFISGAQLRRPRID